MACTVDGQPGWKCGPSGHCYPYTPGDDRSSGKAKQRAVIQCIAIGEDPGMSQTVDTLAIAPQQVAWISDIAFEGAATDDGRYIMPGALDWRDLPLTLMAMTETGPGGHEGAFVAGRIDKIYRARARDMNGNQLPDGVTAIRAEGVFDVQGDNGAEVARLVSDETVRGISIDMAISETALRNPDTGEIVEQASDLDALFMGELQFAVRKGTIMAATVCPTPAFADARIAVTASGQRVLRITSPFTFETEALTAAGAGLAPLRPPREWFDLDEADQPTPLTVTGEGQVFGHMALWDSCHTGYPGSCVPPPQSPSGYAFFNLGEIECDDGSRVSVGSLTLEGLHADTNRPLTANAVRAHYENTAVVAAHVHASDGRHGIWVAGALRPGLSEEHARDLMGAKPSGDWRSVTPGGPLEMLGIHAVNEPGFPVPRLVASALLPSGDRVQFAFYDQSGFERKLAVLGARAEGGIDGLADLAGV